MFRLKTRSSSTAWTTGPATLYIGTALALSALATPTRAQLFANSLQQLQGNADGQRFGEVLTFCDFNGDGFDDLAVGIPEGNVSSGGGTLNAAGYVRIHLGSATGRVDSIASQTIRRDLVGQTSGAGYRFGTALAAADFDLDGACDLAIGAPGVPVGGHLAAGQVTVVYGEQGHLFFDESFTSRTFDLSNLTGAPDTGDRFGSVLAAGPLGDEDAYPDLVVGVPLADIGMADDAGTIHLIISDSSAGLRTAQNARLHQDVLNMFGIVSPNNRFGAALAIGDLTGDGINDIVVGTPGDRVGLVLEAGSIQVIPGGGSGVVIDTELQQLLHQDIDGVAGNAATGDEFGAALAIGEFNGGGGMDLAVGIPGESQFGPEESGAVQIFLGTANGLSTSGQTFFESLISPEIATFDRFGTALQTADFNGDGRDELVVGFPLDNVFGNVNAGNVAVLRGSPSGTVAGGAQLWNGFTLATVETGDVFGTALAVGRPGGEAYGPALAIGAPGRERPLFDGEVGWIGLLTGQAPIFADGFENGDLSAWSTVLP